MMPVDARRAGILDALYELGDIAYARRAWSGLEPDVASSFIEVVCRLYDDFNFQEFVTTHVDAGARKTELEKSCDELRRAIDRVDERSSHEAILASPEWQDVARTAKYVFDLLKQ